MSKEHDIVENLRLCANSSWATMNTRQIMIETLRANDFDDAADEIERLREAKKRALAIADERSMENVGLRADIERLRAALKPLAAVRLWRDTYPDAQTDCVDSDYPVTIEHVRAARAVLADEQRGTK